MAPKIAVLMGGRSLERAISLESGKRVVDALEAKGYVVVPLDIVPTLVDTLRSETPDAVYIALHGKLGEDGTVQELLEFLGIPYTGPDVLASALGWDKHLCKLLFVDKGIPTPPWVSVTADSVKEMGVLGALDLVAARVADFPLCVKPARQGSALGLARVENQEELAEAMLAAFAYDTRVIVEQWISGTELAVSVLGGPDGPRVLAPVEIAPVAGIYDYEAMYTPGKTDYYVPARLPEAVLDRARELAVAVHVMLECRDLSRVDMAVASDGTPYVLECSTLPGMTETSVTAMSAEAEGIEFADLVDLIVRAALARGSAASRFDRTT